MPNYDRDTSVQLREYMNGAAKDVEAGKGNGIRHSIAPLNQIAGAHDRNTGIKADPATTITAEGDLKGGNAAHLLTNLAAPKSLKTFLDGLSPEQKQTVLNAIDAEGRTPAYHATSQTSRGNPLDTKATIKTLSDAGYDFSKAHEVDVNGKKMSLTPAAYAKEMGASSNVIGELNVAEIASKAKNAPEVKETSVSPTQISSEAMVSFTMPQR